MTRFALPIALCAALAGCVAPFLWSAGLVTRPIAGLIGGAFLAVALVSSFLAE